MVTVFLSSTAKNLSEYRKSVYRAIEGLQGYHCVRMEDFGSWDAEPDDFCRARVAECDVFVCLAGPLYGSLTPAGPSYTEREFDAAVENKLPCLVFLTEGGFLLPANLLEPEHLRERQRAFRQKASAGRIIAQFSGSEDIAVKVIQALRNWEASLHRSALTTSTKALGPDHPDIATSMNSLAELYRNQGRHAEAEPLYRRALAIREKALGPDDPDTATSLNNLAALYAQQRRYAEAEPLYRRALAISEKALGPDHPLTAASLNNLALLYAQQRRYAEAEPLYRRALAISEKALGPGLPSTATGPDKRPALSGDQGRYAEGEPPAQRAAISGKALGPDLPSTATTKMEIFLCHSSGDKPHVRNLWEKLKAEGFAPWLDEKELLPGHRWEMEIRKAIDRAGAIIVCLSRDSINKEGFLQREIRLVLDKASEKPDATIFLIPARLEKCDVPLRLAELQWVDLFEDSGYPRLVRALQTRATSLGKGL